jgi:hypothetical protein
MHGKKNGMDDREDLPLSTVPIPDILLATRLKYRSSFLVTLPPPPSKSRDEISLRGRVVTPHIMKSLNASLRS